MKTFENSKGLDNQQNLQNDENTLKSYKSAGYAKYCKSGKALNYDASGTFTWKKATYLADVHCFFFKICF